MSKQIIIPKKFSEKQLDLFMSDLYKHISSYPNDEYVFDFTIAEWISNQNLLLISGLIKYMYKSGMDFKIKLFPDNRNSINSRQARIICQIWDVWKLYRIFDDKHFENYIDNFENQTIPYLYKRFQITPNNELFDRYSVIPFVPLSFIEDSLSDNTLNFQLDPVYKLNDLIKSELRSCNCEHPFAENTLSAIITKELYDNFCDHFQKTIFSSKQNWAFMSISLKRKIQKSDQRILRYNFQTEELEETKSFFFNNGEFKNENVIQFSFFDFGVGIVESLKEQYKLEHNIVDLNLFSNVNDNLVLKYAFKHNTSRNPIYDKYNKIDKYIPRGMFDLLIIVKRYKGMLIVRSNHGKIIYNFSSTDDIEKSFLTFGNMEDYFPGTYYSIYIPAMNNIKKFNKSVIRPEASKFNPAKKFYNVNIFSIISDINYKKANRYNQLISKLSKELKHDEEGNWLTYISFFGVDDIGMIKKTIFYLISSYDINDFNSVIIVHPPSKEIINVINEEILSLANVIKDYKIHPIPLLYNDFENQDVIIDWIGIYDDLDKRKLNTLRFGKDQYNLAITDFNDEYNVIGNTNTIDQFGNFTSKVPSARTILTYYERFESNTVENAIKKFKCIKNDGLYLCNGNYYQNEYLQFTDILNEKKYADIISKLLFEKITLHIKQHFSEISEQTDNIIFIAITASSHKILSSLISERIVRKENCIFFDSYINFEYEHQINEIKENFNYVLVCDAIATGKLTKRLDYLIQKKKSKLIAVSVIVNTLDENFEGYEDFKIKFIDCNRFIFIYKYVIEKISKNRLISLDDKKQIIRINPYTSLPITLSEKETINQTVLLSNEEFLNCINNEDVFIGFNVFNNIVHPYFFNTARILESENRKLEQNDFSESIIFKIFNILRTTYYFNSYSKDYSIFYPKNSDIEHLNFEILKNRILENVEVEYFPLERYNSGNGWKFPHTTDYFKEKISEKPNILIFDDGSCTGDSLFQMINELSYYEPNNIIVLCIIGRVEDHKREFFSKIESIKTASGKSIPVNIYFGVHWHIPTFYRENNPYIEEINWLNKITELKNTPEKIRSNALKIRVEITPLAINDRQNDYKYFPKLSNGVNKIPKLEILRVRNEIGKIIGYRFYKETFTWFDKLLNKTQNYNFNNKEINKEVEELLMCIIYEPYLYKQIIQIIPDIRIVLERFISNIIFDKNLFIDKDLFYNWVDHKIDLIHLYFIAYTDNFLVSHMTLDVFQKLIEFAGDKKINYVLFKLLYYSAYNKKSNESYFDGISTIIDAYLQTDKPNKNVKLFKYFISSLPQKNNFEGNISFVYNEYRKINDSQKHKEAITINIENLLSYIDLLIENNNNVDLFSNIQTNLKPILELLARILSISLSYPYYFSKYISLFESNTNSLRELYERLVNHIESINASSDLPSLYKDIKELRNNFFSSSSIPYKILSNTITDNFIDILLNYKKKYSNLFNVEIYNFSERKTLHFPKFIFEEIIFDEIFSNIEVYADRDVEISIKIVDSTFEIANTPFSKNQLIISIENKIKENPNIGGSYVGIHLIEELNKYPNDMFNYSRSMNDYNIFIQSLIFKSI